MTAAHCEVRLAALRRTKDGTVVSFLVHPNDVPDCFSLDPLGQRYMIGIAAIGDDEQELQSAAEASTPSVLTAVVPERAENRDAPHHLVDSNKGGETGETSATLPHTPHTPHPIVRRAGILANDQRFWAWINVADAEAAAAFIRRACAVASRRDLATNTGAAIRFQGLLDEYLAETGQRAEIRG